MDDVSMIIFFIYTAVVFLTFTLSVVYIWNNYRFGLFHFLIFFVFLCMGYVHLIQYLMSNGGILEVPHFLRTGPVAGFIAIPLMYLIISKKLTNKRFRWQDAIHGLPALLYIINYIPLFLKSTSYKQDIIKNMLIAGDYSHYDEGWLLQNQFINMMMLFQVLLYVILLALLLYEYKRHKINRTYFEPILYWFFGYMLSLVLPTLLFTLGILSDGGLLSISSVYFLITLVFLIIFFLNPAMMYVELYNSNKGSEFNNLSKILSALFFNSKDKKVKLHSRQWLKLKKIEKYLDEFKPYLSENFSLGNLEKETGIAAKQISLSIKKHYNLNFTQFINELRIKYLINMLMEDEKLRQFSIEELSIKIGFSSPNSFYAYFKNYTGKTPREYIDDIIKKEVKLTNENRYSTVVDNFFNTLFRDKFK